MGPGAKGGDERIEEKGDRRGAEREERVGEGEYASLALRG